MGGCFYDTDCVSGQICQGAITNMANPASNKKGSCKQKEVVITSTVDEKTYCMQGFVKKVKGTGMPKQDCPDQFNTYSCAEGISIPKNTCPVGSNFYYSQDALYYEWFKNSPLDENGNLIKNHYFCVSDKVFKPEDLTCAKGFKLTDQAGYATSDVANEYKKPGQSDYDALMEFQNSTLATDPKAKSCIEYTYNKPGPTQGLYGEKCTKKGWIFRCDIVDTEKPKEQPESYMGDGLNGKVPCGTSGAKVMGGMGMGYCCGYPPQ